MHSLREPYAQRGGLMFFPSSNGFSFLPSTLTLFLRPLNVVRRKRNSFAKVFKKKVFNAPPLLGGFFVKKRLLFFFLSDNLFWKCLTLCNGKVTPLQRF